MIALGSPLIETLGPLALVAGFALIRSANPPALRRAARAQLVLVAIGLGARAVDAGAGDRRAALLASVVLLCLAAVAIRRCAVPEFARPRRSGVAGGRLPFSGDAAVLVTGLLVALLAFDAVRDGLAATEARGEVATALATVGVDALALARRADPAARLFRAVAFGGAVLPLVASLPGTNAAALVTAALLAPAALTGAPLLPRLAVTMAGNDELFDADRSDAIARLPERSS